jgi:hypothetical protein
MENYNKLEILIKIILNQLSQSLGMKEKNAIFTAVKPVCPVFARY